MLKGLKKPWRQALAVLMTALMVFGVIPVNPYSEDGGVLQVKADVSSGDTYNVTNGYDAALGKVSSKRTAETAVVGYLDATGKMVTVAPESYGFTFYSGATKAGYVSKDMNNGFNHYSYRLETQGALDYRNAAIEFSVSEGMVGTVEVVWASGSADEARFDKLMRVEDGAFSGSALTPASRVDKDGNACPAQPVKDALYKSTYNNVSAGTYQAGTTNGGYVYEIKISEKVVGGSTKSTYNVTNSYDAALGKVSSKRTAATAVVGYLDATGKMVTVAPESYGFTFYSGATKAGYVSKDMNNGFNHYSYRLETQGALDYRNAAIEFSVSEGMVGTVEVVWASGSADEARFDKLMRVEDGAFSGSALTPASRVDKDGNACPAQPVKDALYKSTYNNVSAGTYQAGTTNGGYVYEIILTEKDKSSVTIPPTVLTITAEQDATDKAKVTGSGTGTPGSKDSEYVVYRVDSANKETKVASVTGGGDTAAFTFVDTLPASGTYTYKAYGKGDTDTKAEAKTTESAITYVKPLAKATVTALADNAKVSLSWKAVDEADTYDALVYQGDSELAEKSVTGLTETSHEVTGLTNGTEYGFVVIAHRTSDGAEVSSDKVTATPVGPEEGVTWFKADKMEAQNITTTVPYEDGSVFNLIGTSGKNLNIETPEEGKTATDGTVFLNRLKLNGTGKMTERAVKVTVAKESHIVIYALSGSATATRTLNLVDSEGTVIETFSINGVTLAPAKAVMLAPGDYYIYSTNSGINIYGIKLKEGPIPLTPWADVETPVIDSLTYDKTTGKITAAYTAQFADEYGADSGIVSLLRLDEENGRYYEIKSVTVTASDKQEFDPPMEGTYAARFSISRSGEADKVAEEKTVVVDVLPPSVPNITWVNNLGDGAVYVDWNNVDADQGYEVEYKAEGADGYTTAVTGLTQGNYTISGLASGTAYTVRVTAKDSIRGSKSDERGFTVAEPKQEWYADVFGSATSGTMTVDGTVFALESYKASYPISKNLAPDVTNGNGTIVTAPTVNGKVADSEDGIQVYYTRINPNTENFKLTATFTVTDDSTVNLQSGYGIYALDIAGLGTKDAKYLNNVTVGNYKFVGGTYHSNGVRYVTGLESYDPTNPDGRTLNNTLMFDRQKVEDTSVNGDSYTYTLEKTDEGFIGTMVGASEPIFIEDANKIMTQEDGSIILALAAARVGVTISDIHFEKTAGSVGGAVATTIAPTFKVHSSTISSTATYEFSGSSNVAGTLVLDDGEDVLAEGTADAGEAFVLPVALWTAGAKNPIRYTFTPDPGIENLTSYEPIIGWINVEYGIGASLSKVIYTAPNASTKGSGAKDDPKDLQTAINSALPGQTIVMLDGVYIPYSGLLVPRNVSGTADSIITLVAENPGSVSVVGAALESDSSLFTLVGSYWHVYGIEFCDTPGKCVCVSGNNNTIEMCIMHDSANSGIQISRYSGEPNDKELWPSNNLIKNCESYNHCDPGRSDADGFAAKLTCGEGNVFDGCISHHNIDDGWDLYAKSTTGSIGQVVIRNCITYSNGWLLEDEDEFNVPRVGTDFGEGNGFKLGGENMYGNHQLINSISYNNHAKGITSNSGPDCEIYNCTSFNNSLDSKSYNYSLYTKASNNKAWILEGALSVFDKDLNPRCTGKAELGESNGVMLSLRSASNYLYDGSKSLNTEGVEATSDWFESVDVTVRPTRNADGSIDMHGLLVIKDDKPANTGARLDNATSVQPEIPEQDPSLFPDDDDDDDSSADTAAGKKLSGLPIINHTDVDVIVVSTMEEAKRAAGITGDDYLEVEIDIMQSDNPAVKLMKDYATQNKLTLATCFDINIYRVTKDGVRVGRITELKSPIQLLVKTPAGVDASKYDFGLLAVHNGVTRFLKDSDNVSNTITAESGDFSPYAIVYGAKGSMTNLKAANNSKASPKTFDESRFIPEISDQQVAEFVKKQTEKQLEQEVADLLITPQASRFPFGIVIVALLALAAFIGGEVIYFRRKKQN